MRRHYREWIVASDAYWRRAYYKWIVGHRIFHTDEFAADIWLSVLLGPVCGFIGAATLMRYIEVDAPLTFLVASVVAAAVFLFFITLWERIRLIDAELELKRLVAPSFDNEAEIRRLLEGDRRYIKKVLRRRENGT